MCSIELRWALAVVLVCCAGAARAAEAPDFNRDVRPILAARCFKCHGPDDGARKAKLRLDTRDGAAHVLGEPNGSELLRRVTSTDETEVMPPPSTKVKLTAREKETLRAWVAAGAKYDQHWAFVKPKRPAVPQIRDAKAAIRNPIDAFILARLQKEGLTLAPEADRYTLVRRVYLDLIGVPPTPEEVEAFVGDESPDAYEKLVDKLLASPHYGERWARKWLDLARYADTNGYEKDRVRSIWPYRDWVIKALNDDMPFDRFTVEQLAGDLLPDATLAQRVATGFHRNTMLNEEGGIDPLEFRYHAVTDRTAVTGTVWLGLTVGCAQCHTHKFDPISHTEYFRLFALLNNADEPEIPVPTPELAKKRAEIEAKIKKLEAELPKKLEPDKLVVAFDAWASAGRERAVKWITVRPAKMEAGPTKLALQSDGSVFASGDAKKRDLYTLVLDDLPAGVTAFRIEALADERLPANGPGRTYYEGPKGDFLLSEFTLTVDGKAVSFPATSEAHTRGNLTAKMALDGHPHTGWGGSGRAGVASSAVFNLAKPLSAKGAKLELLFERHYSASLGRFRLAVTTDERAVKARDLPAEVEELLARPAEKLTAAERNVLFRHWLSVAPELKPARDEIEGLRKQLPAYPTTLVMQERPADHPRPTFRHHRGEFLQPKEEVQPGVPALFGGEQGADAPRSPKNRLTFAKWLVSRDNPLTARVTVNRHWHALFGRGIVRTLDDFGYQGEPPTHPELLDWLALEFVERGWSVKKLHRLIVTSATYRQSSRVTPELLAKDPENRLLARGPRVRLEAEQVRDSALKAAGLLSAKMYGPSVFPPQPPNITTEGAYGKLEWKVSAGEDRYRRGLYTFAKRTAPYAMFQTFDGPSGEACTARREVSNTALQALTMLNDAVLVDVARALAKRAVAHKGETADRVAYLFRLCLVRPPSADEAAALAKFYEAQRARFTTDPDRADAVAGAGEDAIDRAAWTATARAILNLDEFVTRE
jgi:hypothetical protein